MPTLTRRHGQEQHAEHWLILADDIYIGSIGIRAGVPIHADHWQWTVSVYPASQRGVREGGTAGNFSEARAAFERSWREIAPKVTEADRLEHRRERAHTEWKYKMWSTGCRLPTPDGKRPVALLLRRGDRQSGR